MGQKVNCNPQKLASIVSYLQRTRTAHTIKDLEKTLPSVASINGIQVKDYIQSLQDESKIRVEKIGSGNWYWSFASEDKKTRRQALENSKSAHEKAASVVEDLKQKLADVRAQQTDEAEMVDGGAESRRELYAAKTVFDSEIKELEKQVAVYSETDPTEIERKRQEVKGFMVEATQYTDEIASMESWIGGQMGKDSLPQLREMLYGDEMDEEDTVLREI